MIGEILKIIERYAPQIICGVTVVAILIIGIATVAKIQSSKKVRIIEEVEIRRRIIEFT